MPAFQPPLLLLLYQFQNFIDFFSGEPETATLATRWRRITMKCLFCWSVLICVCVGPLALGDEARNAKDDGKKMQGSWKPVAAELGGKPFPDEVLKTMKLVVTDGKYTVTVGKQTDEGTVRLDPAKEPRAMDIVGTKGPNQGKKIPAIYELTDTTLRVCYDLSSKARPKEFKTRADTQLFLVEYKRRKPDGTILDVPFAGLLCLALSREFGTSNPRTGDEVLTEHGLPLYAAKEVRVEARRWTLWAGFWPTWAGRLVTAEFHVIDTKEQARKLSGEVLVYCSEPAELRGRGDLLLWAHWLGIEMARAHPFMGHERPNANIFRAGPNPKAFSLPLKNPMKVTLVFVDKQGHVRHTERHDIIELAHAPLRK